MEVLDFKTYRLTDICPTFSPDDKKMVASWRRTLRTEMQSHELEGQESIQILDFLDSVRRPCDNSNIHEGDAEWLVA